MTATNNDRSDYSGSRRWQMLTYAVAENNNRDKLNFENITIKYSPKLSKTRQQ